MNRFRVGTRTTVGVYPSGGVGGTLHDAGAPRKDASDIYRNGGWGRGVELHGRIDHRPRSLTIATEVPMP